MLLSKIDINRHLKLLFFKTNLTFYNNDPTYTQMVINNEEFM